MRARTIHNAFLCSLVAMVLSFCALTTAEVSGYEQGVSHMMRIVRTVNQPDTTAAGSAEVWIGQKAKHNHWLAAVFFSMSLCCMGAATILLQRQEEG